MIEDRLILCDGRWSLIYNTRLMARRQVIHVHRPSYVINDDDPQSAIDGDQSHATMTDSR